jgi:hypothetical protein
VLEDKVCKGLEEKWRSSSINIHSTLRVLENKFDDCCDQIQHSCIKVMNTFICLEKGIKEDTNQIIQLDNNQSWLEGWEKGMNDLVKEVWDLQETVTGQSTTITTLKVCIREL